MPIGNAYTAIIYRNLVVCHGHSRVLQVVTRGFGRGLGCKGTSELACSTRAGTVMEILSAG